MEHYQLQQLQSGQYIKVVDGEATAGEIRCYFLQKKSPGVEAGYLDVALALAGVTGIISTISAYPVVQVFSVAAFFFSVIGAYNLTWLYIQPRLPITWTRFLTSSLKRRYPWFPLTLWLLFYFIKQAVQLSLSSKDAEDQLLETSYLVLLIAVVLAGLALTIFVLTEHTLPFRPDKYKGESNDCVFISRKNSLRQNSSTDTKHASSFQPCYETNPRSRQSRGFPPRITSDAAISAC